jgi:hypothetical protein
MHNLYALLTDSAEALNALVRIFYAGSPVEIGALLRNEFTSGSLPPLLFNQLMLEIHATLEISPALTQQALALIGDWFSVAPELIEMSTIGAIWRAILRHPNGRESVLRNALDVLDRQYNERNRVSLLDAKRSVFSFLGANANILANEYCERYTVDNQSDEGTASITNAAMFALILRLEKSAFAAPWETRVACVEALGQIAMRSHVTVCEYVHQLLKRLFDADPSSRICVSPSLHVLEKLAKSRRIWVPKVVAVRGCVRVCVRVRELCELMCKGDISDSELEELLQLNNQLNELISKFCSLPRGFSPLGAECKKALYDYWERTKAKPKV